VIADKTPDQARGRVMVTIADRAESKAVTGNLSSGAVAPAPFRAVFSLRRGVSARVRRGGGPM
jgi:hypothetical protein